MRHVELRFQGREIPITTTEVDDSVSCGGMSLRDLLDRELSDNDIAERVSIARRNIGRSKRKNGLAKLRLTAGLSQQQVADSMNIQQPAIARWERNPGSITADNMRALAKALHSSMSEVAQVIEEQLMNQSAMRHEHA